MKGVIDRIDFLSEQDVAIIDYKSGSHNNSKLRPPTSSKPKGGNYWRQLAFYKLLWESRSGEQRNVKQAAISYLDLNKRGELTIESIDLSVGELRKAKQMIRESYDHIMAQHFYTGCGEPTCEWCNFVKEDMLPPAHTTAEIEELDDN